MVEERISQTAQDFGAAVRQVRDARAAALVHCGFGFGVVFVNQRDLTPRRSLRVRVSEKC